MNFFTWKFGLMPRLRERPFPNVQPPPDRIIIVGITAHLCYTCGTLCSTCCGSETIERHRRWRNDNCRDVTALFRFIARLGNGLLRIYAAQYISALWSLRSCVSLLPQPGFSAEGHLLRVIVASPWNGKRVLTIGRSSEVISNNPFIPF